MQKPKFRVGTLSVPAAGQTTRFIERGEDDPGPERGEDDPEIQASSRSTGRQASCSPQAPAEDMPPGGGFGFAGAPGNDRPMISMDRPVGELAGQVGRILAGVPLFLRESGAVVTLCPESGQERGMESRRFCSWVEDFVLFVRGKHDRVSSITTELAAKILEADQFRRELRPLKAVFRVRLPVLTADGKGVELMPPGYHAATRSFCVDSLPYNDDCPASALRWLKEEIYPEFPWADRGADLSGCRSFSVQIAAHLLVFCRLLLCGGRTPAVVFIANQPGSGKTLLARMILSPLHGSVGVQACPREDVELGKLLTAKCAEGAPYLFFDNVRGRLSSEELEGFLTSPVRSGRVLGQSATITASNDLQVVITGNQLTLSGDLARRSLVVDLFCADDAASRSFRHSLTDSWCAKPETRQRFLSALWALVRFWGDSGMPRTEGRVLASFEEASEIVGGITRVMGLCDPFAPPALVVDERSQAVQTLLSALAGGVPSGEVVQYDLDQILEKVKELDLSGVLISDRFRDERKSLGHTLKPWLGRRLVDGAGRPFEFGKHRASSGARYPVTVFGEDE